MKGGWGTPFAENSAKIINLIFEPFPNGQGVELRNKGKGIRPKWSSTLKTKSCFIFLLLTGSSYRGAHSPKKIVLYMPRFNSDSPLKFDVFPSYRLNCPKTGLLTDLPMVCKFKFVRYGHIENYETYNRGLLQDKLQDQM